MILNLERQWNRVNAPILVYHCVPKDADERGSWALPHDDFYAQMAYLARNAIAVCALDTFWEACRTRRPLGQKSVVLPFDDGYAATCDNVEDVLSHYCYPATLSSPPVSSASATQ